MDDTSEVGISVTGHRKSQPYYDARSRSWIINCECGWRHVKYRNEGPVDPHRDHLRDVGAA